MAEEAQQQLGAEENSNLVSEVFLGGEWGLAVQWCSSRASDFEWRGPGFDPH